MMEAVSYLNSFDLRPEEVISTQDRPHRLAVTWLYELPFGPGKQKFNPTNKVASKLVGGWQIQGIYTMQSGGALGFGNAIFTGNLKDIPLPSDQRSASRWFNIDAGFDRATARQLSWNVRTLSSRFNGIRSDGPNNMDLSVIKNTQIKEKA